jgi:hypothetical protein
MRVRLSDQIWLRAAGPIDGPQKHQKLEDLVRFLARRAAEADFAEEVAATDGSDTNDFEKDL